MRIIFLDIDGVLNCELFYKNRKQEGTYAQQSICTDRVKWLNELCKDTGAKVVLSSTWRLGRTIEEIREIFTEVGGTFEVIDKTPNLRHEGCVRGNEIYDWIAKNTELIGCLGANYKDYVIIDDDSDMLLWQAEHFFKTDNYSGLTPTTCYKIKRFFNSVQNIID